MLRKLRELVGRPLVDDFEPNMSTSDMASAFRQIPVHPDHLPFSVIAVYSPVAKKWVFGLLDGMAFGVSPACWSSIACRLFWSR